MSTITLAHVSKRFDDAPDGSPAGITDLSIKASEGEVIALLGPSGCGKSTLLRLIAGLIPPDSGEVLYDNVPLNTIPIGQRGIGMVFQDHALMPHWTARRTVGFFLKLRKREVEVPPRLERVQQITGFDMDTLLDRRPRQLSGGELQRVSIARLLMRDPNVFLFDEPFAHIDAKFRHTARLELRRLLNEFPVTSFYVTHDQSEAVALGTRIAVMRAGRIEQVGAYSTLYSNPLNRFVAEFIGTPPINIFRGHVIDGRWQGESFGGLRVRHDLREGEAVLLGMRAEHLRLLAEGEQDPRAFGAVVQAVTPLLSDRHQLVEARAGREVFNLYAPLDLALAPQSAITCALNEDETLFFDAKTEQRIG